MWNSIQIIFKRKNRIKKKSIKNCSVLFKCFIFNPLKYKALTIYFYFCDALLFGCLIPSQYYSNAASMPPQCRLCTAACISFVWVFYILCSIKDPFFRRYKYWDFSMEMWDSSTPQGSVRNDKTEFYVISTKEKSILFSWIILVNLRI